MGAEQGRPHVRMAIVVTPPLVVTVVRVAGRDALEHLLQVVDAARLELDRRYACCGPDDEDVSDAGLQARRGHGVRNLTGDVKDVAVTLRR